MRGGQPQTQFNSLRAWPFSCGVIIRGSETCRSVCCSNSHIWLERMGLIWMSKTETCECVCLKRNFGVCSWFGPKMEYNGQRKNNSYYIPNGTWFYGRLPSGWTTLCLKAKEFWDVRNRIRYKYFVVNREMDPGRSNNVAVCQTRTI